MAGIGRPFAILARQDLGMLQPLSPFVSAGLVFAFTFAAALAGGLLHRRLPNHHLNPDTSDTIELVMGLIATLSAMVLGLLTATAQNTYSAQGSELEAIAADIVELDRLLAYYGPEASEARGNLAAMTSALAARMESKTALPRRGSPSEMKAFFASIGKLKPQTDEQHFVQSQAFSIGASIRHARAVMDGQDGSSIAWPFLAALVFWLAVLFFGFGLFVQLNATVVGGFLAGSLSVASAIFLILELAHPNHGLMALSNAPLRAALEEMGPPASP